MIHIKEYSGRWHLVRNIGIVRSQSATGSQTGSSRARNIEEYWTGDGWDDQIRFSQSFDSHTEADAYLKQNHEKLDTADD